MSTTLRERFIRAADELPHLDAVAVYRPDLRQPDAEKLAAAGGCDPAELTNRLPGPLNHADFRSAAGFGICRVVKVHRPVPDAHPPARAVRTRRVVVRASRVERR